MPLVSKIYIRLQDGTEDYILTLNENDEVTLAEMSEEGEPGLLDAQSADQGESGEESMDNTDRSEYERLIKGRFKEQFTADTQKLINRRFKKYKTIEEKLSRLEEEAARYADIEKLIAEERAAAVRETEERMNRQFRSNRERAEENALTTRTVRPKLDVSRLTKSERALLATRAQKGEKIHLK